MTTIQQPQNNFDMSTLRYGSGAGGNILKESLEGYIYYVRNLLFEGLQNGSSYSAVVSSIRIDLFNNVSKIVNNLTKTMYHLGQNVYYPDALLKLTKQSPEKETSNYTITRTNLSAVYKTIEYITKNGATTGGGGTVEYVLQGNNAAIESITIPAIFNVNALSNSGRLKLSPGGVVRTLTILVVKKGDLNYLTPIHTYETPKTKSNAVKEFVDILRSQGIVDVSYLSVSSSNVNAYANILPWLIGNYADILHTFPGYKNRVSEKGNLVDVLEANNISVESLWLTVHTLTQKSYTVTEKQVKSKKRVRLPINNQGTSRDEILQFTYANLPAAIFKITKLSPKTELSVTNKSLVATPDIKFSSNGFVKGLKKLPTSATTPAVKLPYKGDAVVQTTKKGPTYNVKDMYRVYVRGTPINVYVPKNNLEALTVLTKLYGGIVETDAMGRSDIELSKQTFKTTSYEYAQEKYNELGSMMSTYQNYYNPATTGYNYNTPNPNPNATVYNPQNTNVQPYVPNTSTSNQTYNAPSTSVVNNPNPTNTSNVNTNVQNPNVNAGVKIPF